VVGHGDVVECAVVGLPDDRLGEQVAAVLRTSRYADALQDCLVDYLRNRLAPFKIPTRWFVAVEFPVTPTGKVRKFELRDAIIRGNLREL
jgi:fatty-acyl-CoA synthase